MIKLGIIIVVLAVVFILVFKIIILLNRYDRDEPVRSGDERNTGHQN
jgi:hypothetical protein